MKKAVIAALFSGLVVFAVPQLAFADHAADHSGDCGAKTEKSEEPQQQEQAPQRQGDREQQDGHGDSGDGGEVLF